MLGAAARLHAEKTGRFGKDLPALVAALATVAAAVAQQCNSVL